MIQLRWYQCQFCWLWFRDTRGIVFGAHLSHHHESGGGNGLNRLGFNCARFCEIIFDRTHLLSQIWHLPMCTHEVNGGSSSFWLFSLRISTSKMSIMKLGSDCAYMCNNHFRSNLPRLRDLDIPSSTNQVRHLSTSSIGNRNGCNKSSFIMLNGSVIVFNLFSFLLI